MLSGRKLLLEIFHMFNFWILCFFFFCLCSNDKDNSMNYDERKVIDDLHPDRKGRGAFQD
jgi:hypothetical protein